MNNKKRTMNIARFVTACLLWHSVLIGAVPSLKANPPAIPRSAPDFNLGQIPSQIVYHGQTLDFLVHSDEAGSNATIVLSALTQPVGPLVFNPASRQVTYTPDAADRRPFAVTLAATGNGTNISQAVILTPLPVPAPEYEVLGWSPLGPLPDAEDKTYISRTEQLSAQPVDFNHQMRRTRRITVTGKTVVLQAGHPNALFDLSGNADISSLTIYAEKVIFRSAVQLPQTELTIYARELRFEDVGAEPASLSTTPLSPTLTPAPGLSGRNGLTAGAVTLHIDGFHSDPGNSVRIVARGGNGQAAGPGRNGVDGLSLPLTPDYGNPWPNNAVYVELRQVNCNDCNPEYVPGSARGARACPTSGESAIPGGRPGNGGNAGMVSSTLDISAVLNLAGGSAGAVATNYSGGRAGTPATAYWIYRDTNKNGSYWHIEAGCANTTNGLGAVSPPAAVPLGQTGTFTTLEHNAFAGQTPYALRMVLAHAKDSYLQNYFEFTRQTLEGYRQDLAAFGASPAWTNLPADWRIEFGQMQVEVDTLLHRLASGLDYFGHGPGYVPLLSFENNAVAYANEIEPSLRVLYLVYYLRTAASTLERKLAAIASAREQLISQISQDTSAHAAAVALVPSLEQEAKSITGQIELLRAEMEQTEKALIRRAQQVQNQKPKVPGWQKALKVLGTISTFIPQLQPISGYLNAGAGAVEVISRVDSQSPWQTIHDLGDVAKQFQAITSPTNQARYQANLFDFTNQLGRLDLAHFTNVIDYVASLNDFAKPISSGVRQIQATLEETSAERSQVETEVRRMQAEFPEVRVIGEQMRQLLVTKEEFAQRLRDAMQSIHSASDRISESLLAIDALDRNRASADAVLDPRAMLYLDGMERRAKERLLKYAYYVRQAYQYRFLRRWTQSANLLPLYDKFRDIAAAGQDHNLTADEFQALSALWTEQLSTVVAELFEQLNSNPPTRSGHIRFSLPSAKRAQLEAGQATTLNLVKDLRLFPNYWENIRIVDLKVYSVAYHTSNGTPDDFGYLIIDVARDDESRLTKDGQSYFSRHPTIGGQSPYQYGAFVDLFDGFIDPVEPSPSYVSLLATLLSREGIPQTRENLLLPALPAADGDLRITLDAITDGAADVILDSLRFEVVVEFDTKRTDLSDIQVETSSEELAPLILCSRVDRFGREYGYGPHLRSFDRDGGVVVFEAPEWYGVWRWVGWRDRNGNSLGTGPTLALNLSGPQTIRAHYVNTELIDSNGDGIPDSFANLYFGTNNIDANADLDGDGLSNRQEYDQRTNPLVADTDGDGMRDGAEVAAGTDPLNSDSAMKLRSLLLAANNVTLFWDSIPGKRYQAEFSSNLVNGSWTSVGLPLTAFSTNASASVTRGPGSRFFRVRLVP